MKKFFSIFVVVVIITITFFPYESEAIKNNDATFKWQTDTVPAAKIYPNPTAGNEVKVESYDTSFIGAKIILYNSAGRKLLEQDFNYGTSVIDLTDYLDRPIGNSLYVLAIQKRGNRKPIFLGKFVAQ